MTAVLNTHAWDHTIDLFILQQYFYADKTFTHENSYVDKLTWF